MIQASFKYIFFIFITLSPLITATAPHQIIDAIQASDLEAVTSLLKNTQLSTIDLNALSAFAQNIIFKRKADLEYDFRDYLRFYANVGIGMGGFFGVGGCWMVGEKVIVRNYNKLLLLPIALGAIISLAAGVTCSVAALYEVFLQKFIQDSIYQNAIKIKLLIDMHH